MYLDYEEYTAMGGNLGNSAFTQWESKAEYEINAQSAGKTGMRISKLPELPQAVKDCTFDLIQFLSVNADSGNKTVTSESQSSGGVSESYSYNVLDKDQIQAECESIIYNTFFGGGIGHLLYRGLTADDV